MRMNSPEGKKILSLVRGGAFAHAGETEAIEMAFGGIPKNRDRVVLDAGCGLGGTADYVFRNGWGRVTGFDRDAVSISSARERFPTCDFVTSDVEAVNSLWREEFDLIYCFNAFYAFPRQEEALAALAKVARMGATFVIFDYTDPEQRYEKSAFRQREDATFWQPIHPATLETRAASRGWKLLASVDIAQDYLRWYDSLVRLIEEHRDEVTAGYGSASYAFVHSFYSDLRDAIADRTIGGGIFTLVRGNETRENDADGAL